MFQIISSEILLSLNLPSLRTIYLGRNDLVNYLMELTICDVDSIPLSRIFSLILFLCLYVYSMLVAYKIDL